MKKTLLVLFVALLAISCDKEDVINPTTYTINYDVEPSEGLSLSYHLLEYNDKGERVNSNNIDVVSIPSKKFTAVDNAVKIKVYFIATYKGNSDNFWIQQIYYLSKGENINIDITGSTLFGSKEP